MPTAGSILSGSCYRISPYHFSNNSRKRSSITTFTVSGTPAINGVAGFGLLKVGSNVKNLIKCVSNESQGFSQDEEEDEDELCPVECVREFYSDEEFTKIIDKAKKSNALVVVDFYRTSCGSCKYIEKGFAKICKSSGDEDVPVIFLKHNVMDEYDEQSEVADRLRIKKVPLFHFYKNGILLEAFATREKERINEAIAKYTSPASQPEIGYLFLYTSESCEVVNKVYYLDLTTLSNGLEGFRGGKELLPFTKLVDNFDASYGVVANDDTVFTFRTNKDAPKYKLVRVDLKSPEIWTDVIPESEKDVFEFALAVNKNQLIVCYLSDVKHVLEVRDLETGSLVHQLPLDIGSVDDISAQREDSVLFFRFTSFLSPGIIYQCDLKTDVPEMTIFREIVVPKFDRTEFEVDQVFVPSKDGTKIPMFIVARKGISLDGSHPCLLYGYGGFNISITPSFGVSRIVLLKHLGAVFCIANIRGGGEYGEEWHKAGSLDKKQNCFDDFISSAEFLVSNGYTQPKKLCIEGGSNGGLLVGACINQRPDIFGCALAHVGVMDMLRFHKFTVGHAWTSDYGCSDKEEEFRSLIKYSPLHNVKRPWEQSSNHMSQYPATMLLTADHDDRVVPLHSLKLLATMQHVLGTSLENSPQKNPIIGRIECKAGHGAGRPTQKQIDESADRYSFMAKVVNASWID